MYTRDDAVRYRDQMHVNPFDIPQRARLLARSRIEGLGSTPERLGNVCGHFGGDYWLSYEKKDGSPAAFCNIATPTTPDQVMGFIPQEDDLAERIASFFTARNSFLGEAVARFSH